jgi:outer membrane receptor protein involved in Fe transport
MEAASSIFQDLRLRLSVGEAGNVPTNLYDWQNTYNITGKFKGSPATYPSRIANPDLSWEKVRTWNIGLDATIFNKLTIEFDWYNRDTKNLIASVPLSLTTGFSGYTANMGELQNKGIEFALSSNIIHTRDFLWHSKLNLAHNKMKITEVYGGAVEITRTPFITRKGESYYSFYTREYAGINPENGKEQWYTNEKLEDGSIKRELTEDPTKANRIITGNAEPDLTGGWLNNFSYKGFELSALLTFSLGGSFYDDGWVSNSGGLYDFTYLPSKVEYDRWKSAGDKTETGRRVFQYTYGNYSSSKWIHSTDHLRLKNVSLAYSLPKELVKKASLGSVRLSVSATNLLTWKKTEGFDPEVPIGYVVGYEFPPLKEVIFGIEVSF